MESIEFGSGCLTGTDTIALGQLVDSVGEPGFMSDLVAYLHDTVGAEHCGLLDLDGAEPARIGAASFDGTNLAAQQIDIYLRNYWRSDPTLNALDDPKIWKCGRMLRLEPDLLPRSGLRDIVYRRGNVSDRIVLSSQVREHRVLLSVIRSHNTGKFPEQSIERLQTIASILMPMVAKHADLVLRKTKFAHGLGSIDNIARYIEKADEKLSRREAEVCARMIYGSSARETCLDLDIGEETVKTYRKRAYTRLGVTNQRELLLWYINHWGNLVSWLQ